MQVESEYLSFLLLSDIHMNYQNIEKVKKWYQSNETHIDYVLLLGDFHNLDNNIKQSDIGQENSVCEINKLLQPIKDLNLQCYLIPGNHDPESMFANQKNNIQLENIHNQIIEIKEDLQILGFGGSVPGYKDGNQVWSGFPFSTEESLRQVFEEIKSKFKQNNKQTILMTHCGPSFSPTSISYDDYNSEIQSGSQTFSEFMKDNNERIILNIHGHTHDGFGYRRIQQSEVVNAGPLLHGNFSIINLIKKDKWSLQNVQFYKL